MKNYLYRPLSIVIIIVAIGFSIAVIKADKVSALWQNGESIKLHIEIDSTPSREKPSWTDSNFRQ
jgi:hypothetical protein